MEGLFLIFKFENGRFVLKQIIKCGTAFLLVLVLCLCLLPTTAFAASKQVYIWNFPLSDDTLKSSGKWGHGALNLRFGYHGRGRWPTALSRVCRKKTMILLRTTMTHGGTA